MARLKGQERRRMQTSSCNAAEERERVCVLVGRDGMITTAS